MFYILKPGTFAQMVETETHYATGVSHQDKLNQQTAVTVWCTGMLGSAVDQPTQPLNNLIE